MSHHQYCHQAAYTHMNPRPHSRTTTFELPVGSDLLYIRSEGSWSGGDLTIKSSGRQDKSTVNVAVTIEYCNKRLLNLFRVCKMQSRRSSGETGVGIFTPVDLCRCASCLHSVRVKTVVIFPRGEHLSPLWIKKLETNVDNTDLAIDVDKKYLCFDYLKLCATNGQVSSIAPMFMTEGFIQTSNAGVCGSFMATRNLTVKTINGSIKGQYVSLSGSLDIETSNSPIEKATFVLENRDASKTSVLKLETCNAPIDADIYLEGDTRNPKYEITAQTSNRPLNLSIQTMPVDSTLILSGNTSNKSAYISLPAEYQGSFNVRTYNDRAEVVKSTRRDPRGAGRTRVWWSSSPRNSKTIVSGLSYWPDGRGDLDVPNGSVALSTSNAKATLEL
ncbi:hypothetical protein DFP72DRAFT_1114571 [Ephemerocybe angulata]|uniref:DUF7330 domain-containing protein n=1 Tax=Ephemerocybe angulata TaxID=980116 RepID=A0A8H6I129_9AGAR|nr:hypothetical protein DFP72DRAFT_1114571 [Tulosesus angulatus]